MSVTWRRRGGPLFSCKERAVVATHAGGVWQWRKSFLLPIHCELSLKCKGRKPTGNSGIKARGWELSEICKFDEVDIWSAVVNKSYLQVSGKKIFLFVFIEWGDSNRYSCGRYNRQESERK